MNSWIGPLLSLAVALSMLAGPRDALACACCTNEGQRNVGTAALDSGKQQQIESLRFGGKAKLFTGEADVESVSGIALFEVDPRNGPDGGQGPALYKEWKLSAPSAASGVFAPGGGPRQILTLILQGHGNSCTDANDFSHWTLVMQGPKANYTLFGDLVTAR